MGIVHELFYVTFRNQILVQYASNLGTTWGLYYLSRARLQGSRAVEKEFPRLAIVLLAV